MNGHSAEFFLCCGFDACGVGVKHYHVAVVASACAAPDAGQVYRLQQIGLALGIVASENVNAWGEVDGGVSVVSEVGEVEGLKNHLKHYITNFGLGIDFSGGGYHMGMIQRAINYFRRRSWEKQMRALPVETVCEIKRDHASSIVADIWHQHKIQEKVMQEAFSRMQNSEGTSFVSANMETFASEDGGITTHALKGGSMNFAIYTTPKEVEAIKLSTVNHTCKGCKIKNPVGTCDINELPVGKIMKDVAASM